MNDGPNRFDVSRRQLIRGAVGVLGACTAASALSACGMPEGTMPIDAGAVSDYSVGTFVAVGAVIVGRDANGLYAYSRICTHAGGTIPAPAGLGAESICPQHLSRFDSNGDVLPGQDAMRNLAHYTVTIEGGRVMVDPSMVVTDRAARTAVPA